MTLLAIDPGRSKLLPSIGYALFTDAGAEIERGELTWDGLWQSLWLYAGRGSGLSFTLLGPLRHFSIKAVVIENFINNPKSRGGQTNGTSEVIGAVEFLCAQGDVPFTRQPNTVLPVAKLHAGYVDRRKHLPHQDAAYLHGYYYLVGKGVLVSKGLEATL